MSSPASTSAAAVQLQGSEHIVLAAWQTIHDTVGRCLIMSESSLEGWCAVVMLGVLTQMCLPGFLSAASFSLTFFPLPGCMQ